MRRPKESIPADVAKVQALFDTWRKTREKRGQIPDCLWRKAIGLCDRHKITKVLKWLGLNHKALKNKMVDLKPEKEIVPKNTFVAVPNHIAMPSANCQVEFQRVDGCVMKIAVPADSLVDLANGFLGG